MRRPSPVVLQRFLIAAVVCNLLLLAWYLGVDYRAYLHSDTAVKNTLAQEILDTGRYFPPQWNYVNGDLWVLFTQTLVLPFLLVLPNGFAAHAAAGAAAAALVLHATWLLGDIAGQSRTARLCSLLVVSAGLSLNLAENLYGQAAYGLLYCMGAWLLVCAVRAVRAHGRTRTTWTAAAAAILLLVFWANPQRAAAYYLAPLMAATGVVLLRQHAMPKLRDVALAAGLLAGAVAGTLLYVYTCRQVSTGAVATLMFVGLDGARVNAGHFLEGLFLLLTNLPVPGNRVMSGQGIVTVLYLMTAVLFLFVLLPWTVRRVWQQRMAHLDVLLVFALAGLAVTGVLTLATTLSLYSSSDGAIRYLVPHLLVLLVIFIGAAVDRRTPFTPLAVLAIAVVALFGARSLVTYGPMTKANFTRVHTQQADRMIAFFHQHGLAYGYAPFWDAGRLTVLADHRVRLRQITIENGLPVPMRHLSSNRWYAPDTWHGRTFLLLNTEEQRTFRPDLMAARAGRPAATFNFEGWLIVVYDHNIAADLSAWDMTYKTPRHFAADDAMPHLVGRVQKDPQAIVAAPGEAGVLSFGQNLALAPGRYIATFDIDAGGTGTAFGTVDVVSERGSTSHGKLPIAVAGRQRLAVPVEVRHATIDLELRTISNGSGRVALYGVTLRAAQP